MRPGVATLLAAVLGLAPPVWAAADDKAAGQVFYRYKDAQGVTVMNSQIPPEFVRNGYQVVNAQGMVLQEVPRALSDADLAHQSEEMKRKAQEQAQRKKDEALLLRYSSLEDVEAARARTLSEIDVRISILRGNIIASKQQVEREVSRAADLERAGRKVSPELLKAIEDFKRDIADNEAQIVQRELEKEQASTAFAEDAARMRVLLEKLRARGQ